MARATNWYRRAGAALRYQGEVDTVRYNNTTDPAGAIELLFRTTGDGFIALWNRGARSGHFDTIYLAGYRAGQDAVKAGEPTDSSQPAWERAQR